MEFWEGAVLIVGGVWLVSTMAKKPAYGGAATVAKSTQATPGLTTLTNTAGTSNLVAGEPLTPAGPAIPSKAVTVNTPVGAAPVRAPMISHFSPSGTPKQRAYYNL